MKFLVALALFATVRVFGQTAPAEAASQKAGPFNSNQSAPTAAAGRVAPRYPGRAAPPFTAAPENYSGWSGPGEPVTGAGLGGWRSGREGVRYQGPHPKPGWQLDWDGKKTSSDLVIEQGLLPPIKPLLELHLRDTIIRPGGDGYFYMTGSTGDNIWDRNNGIELWRSKNLQQWEYRGVVWDIDKDGTWQRQCRYVWAPEIHYTKGNYYLTYCMSGGPNGGTGILKSTSGKAEGPYVSATTIDAKLTGGIDATLFTDDDGAVYFTWGRGTTIYRMKDDLSGFADAGHEVAIDPASLAKAKEQGKGQSAAFEGASLFKRNGKYYLGGAIFIGGIDRTTGRNGRYSSAIMIADHLYGPYRQWHEAVPCGGGGNYFQDAAGHWYCTYFGNDEASPFREKPALVRIDFAADNTIVIADEQPAFALRDGTPTHWRSAHAAAVTAAPPPHRDTPATVKRDATPAVPTEWMGYARNNFDSAGRAGFVVQPKAPAPGNLWIWRTEFFGTEPQGDLALLAKGWRVAYVDVRNLYGAPVALDAMDAFYAQVVHDCHLAPKVVLEGFSRGGLFAFNWAARHPERVASIYADAPVLDFKSWPGGRGQGAGSPADWQRLLKAYGLTEAQALAYTLNPIDHLKPLAEAKIPILGVCGDADKTVPFEENSQLAAERYHQLGGEFKVIVKPGGDHHPHSLADPQPIVEWILAHAPATP